MKAFAAVLCAALAACTRSGPSVTDGTARVIDGAGATLPSPLYLKWSTEFARVDSTVRVNYQPLGSGVGIRQMSDGVIDFGATDAPMTDAQLAGSDLVHVPMTIGAVVVAFNLEGVTSLKLAPDVLAEVFRGTITRWDDAKLKGENPEAALPSQPITVVHRADGSGTSAAFTTYLAKHSEPWRTAVGAGTSPRFPVGVGARGNDGVAAYVKQTPNAIGYVELAYARQAQLATALVKNSSGAYVTPSVEALDRAARSALARMGGDLRVSIIDPPDPRAYPIAALSYLIVPRDGKHQGKAEALARFLWWGIHDGQKYAAALDYAPLPQEIVTRAELTVRSLKGEGKAITLPEPRPGS